MIKKSNFKISLKNANQNNPTAGDDVSTSPDMTHEMEVSRLNDLSVNEPDNPEIPDLQKRIDTRIQRARDIDPISHDLFYDPNSGRYHGGLTVTAPMTKESPDDMVKRIAPSLDGVDHVAKVLGIPAGSRVSLLSRKSKNPPGENLLVSYHSPKHGIRAERLIKPQEKVIHNQDFVIEDPALQKMGVGSRVLAAQIHHARESGFDSINIDSAYGYGSSHHSTKRYLPYYGFYVWPLMGFNANLNPNRKQLYAELINLENREHHVGIRKALNADGSDSPITPNHIPDTIHGLIHKYPKFLEFWREHGIPIQNLFFKLNPARNPSGYVFDKYKERKGIYVPVQENLEGRGIIKKSLGKSIIRLRQVLKSASDDLDEPHEANHPDSDLVELDHSVKPDPISRELFLDEDSGRYHSGEPHPSYGDSSMEEREPKFNGKSRAVNDIDGIKIDDIHIMLGVPKKTRSSSSIYRKPNDPTPESIYVDYEGDYCNGSRFIDRTSPTSRSRGSSSTSQHPSISLSGSKVFDNKRGYGSRILASMAQNAPLYGIRSIGMSEASGFGEEGKLWIKPGRDKIFNSHLGMYGYYVWPLLGFDGELKSPDQPGLDIDKFEKELKKTFGLKKVPKTIQELYKIPGGAEWWRRHGFPLGDLSMDLTKPNPVLESYLKRKGIIVPKFKRRLK
jgi:hypothetical protein